MTEPATVGDLPTIDQARAIAAANDTHVVHRWYHVGLPHRNAGAALAKPPGATGPLGGPI